GPTVPTRSIPRRGRRTAVFARQPPMSRAASTRTQTGVRRELSSHTPLCLVHAGNDSGLPGTEAARAGRHVLQGAPDTAGEHPAWGGRVGRAGLFVPRDDRTVHEDEHAP